MPLRQARQTSKPSIAALVRRNPALPAVFIATTEPKQSTQCPRQRSGRSQSEQSTAAVPQFEKTLHARDALLSARFLSNGRIWNTKV